MSTSCGVIEGTSYEQVAEAVHRAAQTSSVRLVKYGTVSDDRAVALLMGETASMRLALEAIQPEDGGDALLITRFICNPNRRCAGHFMKLINEVKAPGRRSESASSGVRWSHWLRRLWTWRAA